MNKSEAAQRLGVPEREVIDVADSAAGPVVRTFDGQTYVIVPEDQRDANGRNGVMFLTPPANTYAGSTLVYSPIVAPVSDATLDERREQVEKQLGVDLKDPPLRSGQMSPGDPSPDAGLSEAEVVITAQALVDDRGPGAPTALVADGDNPPTPPASPGDTGDGSEPENIPDPADPADPGTVVPDGSAHQVLAWVGEDPARAQQALDFERSKDAPRARLVNSLATLAGEPVRVTEGS